MTIWNHNDFYHDKPDIKIGDVIHFDSYQDEVVMSFDNEDQCFITNDIDQNRFRIIYSDRFESYAILYIV